MLRSPTAVNNAGDQCVYVSAPLYETTRPIAAYDIRPQPLEYPINYYLLPDELFLLTLLSHTSIITHWARVSVQNERVMAIALHAG